MDNNSRLPDEVEDFYAVLEISRLASDEDIRKAYRRLALKYHPDKIKDPAGRDEAEKQFKTICQAYEILKDPHLRLDYDRHGFSGRSNSNSTGSQFESQSFQPDPFAELHRHGFGNRPFTGFAFRSPHDIFREFFADFPMAGGGGGFGGMMQPGVMDMSPIVDPFGSSSFAHPHPMMMMMGNPFGGLSSGFPASPGRVVSSSYSSSTINGVKTSVARQLDSSGNLTEIVQLPDGSTRLSTRGQQRIRRGRS